MRIIAGEWKGRRLAAVPGRRVRPTTDRVREAWMSIVQGHLTGARVLDLFSGSGALGLEALSRGAAHCTFVERSRAVVRVLTRNVEQLGASDRVQVTTGDGIAFAKRLQTSRGVESERGFGYDIVLADPPYDRGFGRALVDLFRAGPFAPMLWVEHRREEEVVAEDRADPLSGVQARIDRRTYGDTALTGIIYESTTSRSTKTSPT